MTVLVVRPADDTAAQQAATWGQAVLNYLSKGQVTDMAGAAVSHSAVHTALSRHAHLFWFGHGLEDELVANGNPVVDRANLGQLGGGIVVAVACYAAKGLGPKAVAAGYCDSFLGFDDEFVWQPKAPMPTQLAVTTGLSCLFTHSHDIGCAARVLHRKLDELQDYFKRNGALWGLSSGETCFAWMAAKNNMHSLRVFGSSSTKI